MVPLNLILRNLTKILFYCLFDDFTYVAWIQLQFCSTSQTSQRSILSAKLCFYCHFEFSVWVWWSGNGKRFQRQPVTWRKKERFWPVTLKHSGKTFQEFKGSAMNLGSEKNCCLVVTVHIIHGNKHWLCVTVGIHTRCGLKKESWLRNDYWTELMLWFHAG